MTVKVFHLVGMPQANDGVVDEVCISAGAHAGMAAVT